MKKRLDEDTIKNELQESVYFQKTGNKNINSMGLPVNKLKSNPSDDILPPSNHDTMQPSNYDTMQPSNHDTVIPSNHDTVIPRYHGDILENVRKALKAYGKEAATHRFTPKEKHEITALIYAYKKQGIRTNENEIARIAINFILRDYKEFGEESILDLVLKLLNE